MNKPSLYTTMQGDTFDGIAYRLWGHERLLDALLRANPDHADTLIFPAGVVLTVPDMNLSATFEPASELPPWMQ